MGLFSSTKIYVSSTVYNLAGDEINRPDYLKSLVLGNLLTKTDMDIADTIQSGYIKGPGIKLRNFFRWAEDNYDYIGMPLGGFFSVNDVDNAVIITNIPHSVGDVVTLSEVVVGGADVHYFALQWMFDNYPLQIDTAWTSDYDDVTNEIVVTLADTTVHRFTPTGWNQKADYIYATYSISVPGTAAAIVGGTTFTTAWPSTAGYTNTSSTDTPHTVTLHDVTTVTTTVGAGASSTTTSDSPTTPTWHELHQVWEKTVYQGKDPLIDRIWSLRTIMYLNQSAHIVTTTTSSTSSSTTSGVTTTVTTTHAVDSIVYDYSWRKDTQDITVTSFIGPKMFIYELFSGIPALDAAVHKTTPTEQYYPFIPARLDNVMVDQAHFPDAYPIVKKAYKKSTSGKYDKFVYNIAHNDHIADIDYAYCVFGVSVNVLERDCREYMYRYLHGLMTSQTHGAGAYSTWKTGNTTAAAANATWLAWKAAQTNALDPLFGTPEPAIPAFVSMPTNEVRITSSSSHINANYDIRISWQYIEESTGTGLIEVGRKPDEIWWTYNGSEVLPTSLKTSGRTITIEELVLNWQLTDTTWKKLKVVGMVHRNYIYKGKFVEIGLRDGVSDPKESGFIMPLHYQIYAHDMPLVKSTQMATACCFVVFNCYVVKKTGFFGSFFFKILLFVVIIAVSVYFPPASGLLGSNAAVGAALGFSGLSALVVGAVANLIAATLLLKIIGTLSTVIFGAKFGALFGAIAGFLAMTVGVGMFSGMNFSTAIHQLSDIRNIMGLANATGQGVQGYIQGVISDMGTQLTHLQEQTDKQLTDLHKLYADNIGYGRASFDARSLTDVVPFIPEAPQVFLNRTQMTGTDNIALQLSYISKFVDLTISTDLP